MATKSELNKLIPVSCPKCDKEFKNIYSLSAHKSHCGKPSGERTRHFDGIRGKWSKGKILKSDDEIFCEKSKCDTGYARKAILVLKYKEYRCLECGINSWKGENIVLELDHINGVSNDHRLENLRFLCPNCHSQTETFCGKNKNTGRTKVSDEILSSALEKHKSIRQALLEVGLAPKGGNYKRCYVLKTKHNL